MLGVFDSGVGGLTVVRAIERRVPGAGYVYLGDTARLPYGIKSQKTIERYAMQALAFLRESGADQPVIACHTVSAALIGNPAFRRTCASIYSGIEPRDVVTPAIAAAKRETKSGRIGVLATTATIRSGVYQRALRRFRVVPVAASVLVAIAEEGWAFRRDVRQGRGRAITPMLREILKPFARAHVDTVVLACTHFPIFKPHIRAILKPSVHIIDPGEELAAILAASHSVKRGSRNYFATDIPDDFSERASRFLGRAVHASPVTL